MCCACYLNCKSRETQKNLAHEIDKEMFLNSDGNDELNFSFVVDFGVASSRRRETFFQLKT